MMPTGNVDNTAVICSQIANLTSCALNWTFENVPDNGTARHIRLRAPFAELLVNPSDMTIIDGGVMCNNYKENIPVVRTLHAFYSSSTRTRSLMNRLARRLLSTTPPAMDDRDWKEVDMSIHRMMCILRMDTEQHNKDDDIFQQHLKYLCNIINNIELLTSFIRMK